MEYTKNLSWGIERRLEFIEFLLYWEGRVNRKNITQFFGVSVPQASGDIQRYQKLAPDNIAYDRSKKYYFAPNSFQPKLITPNAEQYLVQLLARQSDETDSLSYYGQSLEYAVLPRLQRKVNETILRTVLGAIRNQQGLEVKYQSFSHPDPSWRWITPHALGFGSRRWHCRCYCERHQDFRDFALSRILEIRQYKSQAIDAQQDIHWQTHIDIKIGANPELSINQQQVIATDYNMTEGQLGLRTKVALVDYFLREHKLYEKALQPRQQLVLLNRAEITAVKQRLDQHKLVDVIL